MRASIALLFFALGAREARADPPARNPDLATQRMMLDIASGALPLVRFVDDEVGVVFIDHFAGAADVPEPSIEKRLCGRALARFVRSWQRRGSEIRVAHDQGFLACQNRSGPPTCTLGRSMEWDPATHFIFVPSADRGLLLRAITIDDEVLVDPRTTDREHRTQSRLIDRLTRTACPSR